MKVNMIVILILILEWFQALLFRPDQDPDQNFFFQTESGSNHILKTGPRFGFDIIKNHMEPDSQPGLKSGPKEKVVVLENIAERPSLRQYCES